MSSAATLEKDYSDCLNSIILLEPADSVSMILKKLSSIPEDVSFRDAILTEMDRTKVFPDSLMKILIFIKFIQVEREAANSLYEESMSRYSTINHFTGKRKSTDDEVKIKKTLTDFILKIEALFEENDRGDEGILREMALCMKESNLSGSSGREFLNFKVSSSFFPQIQSFMEKLILVYFEYKKNAVVLKRLIRISGFIIEDAEKRN
ncbi:MAG: hypothetical protein K8R21_01090 [Leptospira sp.]|nr:hypothetical protein [Leptospira sp.]